MTEYERYFFTSNPMNNSTEVRATPFLVNLPPGLPDHSEAAPKARQNKAGRFVFPLISLILFISLIAVIVSKGGVVEKRDEVTITKPEQGIPVHPPCNSFPCIYIDGDYPKPAEVTTEKSKEVLRTPRCDTLPCKRTGQQLSSSLNPHADACDDFYDFVCKGWEDANPVPVNSDIFSPLIKLQLETEDRVHASLKKIDEKNDPSKTFRNLKKFYESCVNIGRMTNGDLNVLKEVLKQMGGWPLADPGWNETAFHWPTATAIMLKMNRMSPLITVNVRPDPRNLSRNVIFMGYRASKIFPSINDRNKFTIDAIIAVMGPLVKNAVTSLSGAVSQHFDDEIYEMLKVERSFPKDGGTEDNLWLTSIGKFSILLEKNWMEFYQILTTDSLQQPLTPDDPILTYGTSDGCKLIQMVEALDTIPPRALANYLGWRMMVNLLEFLPDSIRSPIENLNPDVSPPNRFKFCFSQMMTSMNRAVSSLALRDLRLPLGVSVAQEMVHRIMMQFEKSMRSATWIDFESKEKAIAKLKSMKMVVAQDSFATLEQLDNYYSEMGDLGDNVLASIFKNNLFRFKEEIKMLEVDNRFSNRSSLEQFKVNGAYMLTTNTIILPAAILQPPIFDPNLPMVVNLAKLGAIVGHEVMHAFDVQGGKLDAKGLKDSIWTNRTSQELRKREKCLVEQYNDYAISGEETIGENMADLVGVSQAYKVYQDWRRTHGNVTLPGMEQFTPDQLFFISYSSIWCRSLPKRKKREVHSPMNLRVLGTLVNMEEFAQAFQCHRGKGYNPDRTRCELW